MSGVKQAFLNMIDGDAATSAWGGMVSGVMGAVGKGSSGGTVDASSASGAAGWGNTLGGTVAVAGGAYGMYSGYNNIKNGNAGVGAVQTGLGAYSTYQGAVTLGMIEKGTATGVAKGLAAKVGYGAASQGATAGSTAYTAGSGATSYGTFQAGASTGASAAGGSSAGAGAAAAGAAAYAIPIAAAALVVYSAINKANRPSASAQIDEAGITPANLTGFYDGMKGIENSILETVPVLSRYEQAMYSQNSSLLVATGSLGTIALKFDETAEAGHQWSRVLQTGSDVLRSNIIEAQQFSAALGVSAEGMGVAAEIAYSEKESLDVLSAALQGMGESAYTVAGTVNEAASSIKSAYSALDSINYDDPETDKILSMTAVEDNEELNEEEFKKFVDED